MSSALQTIQLTGVEPACVIGGGRLWLRGSGLPLPSPATPEIFIGAVPARVVFSAPDRVAVEVPMGLEGGPTEVRAAWAPGVTLFVQVGLPCATGLHQVDSPVVDGAGCIYVTYSGSRGQEAPVSVFRVTPGGAREPFVLGLVNATSLAFGPDGRLYVSSRFDGSVSRVQEDGRYDAVASGLGQASGLAFAPDGRCFVGDRTGTIYCIDQAGKAEPFATLPASIAAFHLAMGPDGALYVTGPTLSTFDTIYRLQMDGRVEPIDRPFGRPQGLAFDPAGRLHVVEALAGSSGVYRIRDAGPRELVVSGPKLVGVTFAGDGGMVVASSDTVYRFA